MEKERKLSWGSKILYGADGIGYGFFSTFVATYIMVYMGLIGLNSGIIGTLMLVSKIFDGVSDILMGSVIDKTNTKWGKARPWVLIGAIPLAVTEILMFSVPGFSDVARYAYFFVIYTAANAVFFTMNNCAYNTLSNLITYNKNERVQLGAIELIGESIAGVIIPIACTRIVAAFGGGVTGWRVTAIVFALAQLAASLVTVLGTKELPPEKIDTDAQTEDVKNVSFWKILKIVITNKYYIVLLCISVLIACIGTSFFTSGAYYCQWILGNSEILSLISGAFSLGMLCGMFTNPILVQKIGYRKTMGYMNVLSVIFLIFFAVGAYRKNVPMMVVTMFLKNMTGFSSIGCCLYAAVGDVAKYSYRLHGVHVEGSVFSCSSMGRKVGQGVTVSICGWMLSAGGFVATAAAQSAKALNMIKLMYAGLPLFFTVLLTICCFLLRAEEANARWEKEHAISKNK